MACKLADPLEPAESVIDFQKEMRLADASWQINIYGDAKHSLTGGGAVGDRTPEAGLHAQTEARSWQATVEFLREVFK
jgi:dienelactone hydrolase